MCQRPVSCRTQPCRSHQGVSQLHVQLQESVAGSFVGMQKGSKDGKRQRVTLFLCSGDALADASPIYTGMDHVIGSKSD
jgi:hypothetical protein